MPKKRTYQELEQRVKDLEQETAKRTQADDKIKHLNLVLRAVRNDKTASSCLREPHRESGPL